LTQILATGRACARPSQEKVLMQRSSIDWDDGRRIRLSGGDTARCTKLAKGQIYALVLYNSSEFDQRAEVSIVWSNKVPPATVQLRGATDGQGPASFAFISGSDTGTVSVSLGATSTASVTVILVSLTMPANTEGIQNQTLPIDGKLHDFPIFTRYEAQFPASGWISLSVQNKNTQFICLQFQQDKAAVLVVNKGSGLYDGQLSKLGPTASDGAAVTVSETTYQVYNPDPFQASGRRWVWMNGDSEANSTGATIALQNLSVLTALIRSSAARVSSLARDLPRLPWRATAEPANDAGAIQSSGLRRTQR